ncbi:MAG TPA: DUF2877 domain-containing protein [Chloroflexota bacterium]
MPNGLECELSEPAPQAPVWVGRGRLECDFGTVHLGPLWDPRPLPRFTVSTHPGLPSWSLESLVGKGPGLTPLGDDVVAGYLGACALFGGGCVAGAELVASLATQTTSLSGTLLQLAASGQLPEVAHRLLEDGDAGPILSWGATSGSGFLAGLGLRGAPSGSSAGQRLHLLLPLDPPRHLTVEIRELSIRHFGV